MEEVIELEIENDAEATEQLPTDPEGENAEMELALEPSKRKKPYGRNSASRKKQKLSTVSDVDKNATMLLHEKYPIATYTILSQGGPVHQPMFTIEVKINDQAFVGAGCSKKKARLAAAEMAVEALNLRPAGMTSDINFTADDLSMVMQESTDDGFVVNQRGAVAAGPKVEKVPEPIGKSPLLILNELRPGQQYEWRAVDGSLEKDEKKEDRSAGQKYTCVLMVDEQLFEEIGNSRKAAKAKVAAAALNHLFGIQFVHTSEGIPVFQGDDSEWIPYKPKEEELVFPEVCNGKNPIQMLNELFPSLAYKDLSEGENVKTFGRKFTFAVEFEGEVYQAEGNSKKLAKTKCALAVVLGLEKSGILAMKRAEKEAKVPKRKLRQSGQSWNSRGKPGSSVIKLAVHFPNLEYRLISQTDMWNNGQMSYTVAVTVRGETFTGTHANEIGARDQVAEKVLTHFGLAASGDAQSEAPKIEADSSTPQTQDQLASKGLN